MKNINTPLILSLLLMIILSTIVHVATWNYKHSKNNLAYSQNYEKRDQKKSQSAIPVKTENNCTTSKSDEGLSGENLRDQKTLIEKKLKSIQGS